MNISAVLKDLGHPWIDGYKPYGNYQKLLFDVVEARLNADKSTQDIVKELILAPFEAPPISDLKSTCENPPKAESFNYIVDPGLTEKRKHQPRITDWITLDARNQSLGLAGEKFVLDFESKRLYEAGKKKLANKIEHISKTRGDGLGYDILSYEDSGKERLIEVKTTTLGKRNPFYVTRNELNCSVLQDDVYHLYRVFSFRTNPRLYQLKGRLDRNFDLDPVQYRARR